ncbi:ABC transporter permease [Pantoea sp. USHLN256]|uniref:ABC transporter permease n=1 Tax=Pantoea sp. USHLN256 TaxID=3081293 RepID=UPI00301A20C0
MSEVTQAAAGEQPRRTHGQQWLQHVSLLIIVLVLAVFAWLSPIFLTVMNLGNVLQQTAVVGTLALGLTLVLSGGGLQGITGGIDLSIAANLGLSAAVFASQLSVGQPLAIALLLTLLTGAAVGLFNALAIVWLGILPLLATLTSMNIAIGLEMVLTSNASVSASSDLQNLLLSNGPLAVSWLGWSFLLLAFAAIALSRLTAFGLRLQAVGSHPQAANAAGIGVKRYQGLSYVLCGVSAAIAAVASVSLLSGSSPGANDNLLMVIAAALLGVVFSRRLVPTLAGALISALFLSLLANGFQLINVSSYWINGVEGVLILLVVALTALLRRRQSRRTQGV